MRYQLSEGTYILGKFNEGDTVSITLYNLTDDSVVSLSSSNCSEITDGIFKWNTSNISQFPTSKAEYLWIMSNGSFSKYGKITLGGFVDLIDQSITTSQSNINSHIDSAMSSMQTTY